MVFLSRARGRLRAMPWKRRVNAILDGWQGWCVRARMSAPSSVAARRAIARVACLVAVVVGLLVCASTVAGCTPATNDSATLVLGAYTTPREAYGRAILPAFRAHAKETLGITVDVRESYLASGAQARAIVGGFDADVAALSLSPDIDVLVEAGLVKSTWRASLDKSEGIVHRSIVVIGVREGNPKGIRDWGDLAREGVDVLTPNVKTSGGAMWNVLALYGAVWRAAKGEPIERAATAERALADVLKNVRVMDRGARDSLLTFERGVGDAIITYENELLVGRAAGQRYEIVVPSSTILIENPVAIVDSVVEKRGTRALAESFVRFLVTPAAQRAFAAHGLRPVDEEIARATAGEFSVARDVFRVEDLGGWPVVLRDVFADDALYARALSASRDGAP